jgi:hypothetical protein
MRLVNFAEAAKGTADEIARDQTRVHGDLVRNFARATQ